MKKNIAIICLNDYLRKETAKQLAKIKKMHYLDIDELVDFELISRKQVALQCGDVFLKKIERECISRVMEYESCVFSISVDLYLANDNSILLNDCKIVYLSTEMHKIDLSTVKNKKEKLKLQQAMDINNNINEFLIKTSKYVVENADMKSIDDIVIEIKSKK